MGAGKFGLANVYELEDVVRSAALTQSKPFYEKAFQQTIALSPRLKALLQHPRLRDAYEVGQRLADDEALAGIGHGLDIPGLPARDLAKSLTASGVPAARAQALADAQFPAELPLRALDYMKRGLDVVIDKGLHVEKTLDRRAAQALASMRAEVVAAMKHQSAAYEAATGMYAGAQEFADALVEGQAFQKHTSGEIARFLRGLSPSERDAYRIGASQSLYESLLGATDAARRAGGSMFGQRTPMAERVRAMFPDAPTTADEFLRMVNGEARLSFTTQRVTTRGPSTSPQILEQALEGNIPPARASFGLTVLSGLRQMVTRERTRLDSEVGDELTRLFLKGMNGPTELHDFLTGLGATARAMRRQAAVQRGAAVLTGTLAGKAAGGQTR